MNNSKIYLSPRLKSAANLVNENRSVADIGCDHGFVSIYLALNNISNNIFACDIKKGPLSKAKQNIDYYQLNSVIKLKLCYGLDLLNKNDVDEILICGMGGIMISNIIEKTSWLKSSDKHLILQPMTHISYLHKFMFDNGFYIDKEFVVAEKNRLYIIISAYYNGESVIYSDLDCEIGRLNPTNDLSKKYFKQRLNAINKKINGLKNSSVPSENINKLNHIKSKLENIVYLD